MIHNETQFNDGLPRVKRVAEVIRCDVDVVQIRFDENIEEALPGQFVMPWIPGFDSKPYMIANGTPFEIFVRSVGPFSQLISQCSVGPDIPIFGPFGRPFEPPKENSPIYYIDSSAGVASVATLRFLTERYSLNPEVVVDNGCENIELIRQLFGDFKLSESLEGFFDELINHPSRSLYMSADYRSITKIRAFIETWSSRHSGRRRQVCENSRTPDQPQIQVIRTDAYIACGMGICGRCALSDGQLLCSDGPIFRI